jgi:hypothetical protein
MFEGEVRPVKIPRFEGDAPAVRWRELLALIAIVVCWDLAIYHGGGFSGWALVMAATPLLLTLGAARRVKDQTLYVLLPLIAVLAGRIVWCGSVEGSFVGLALVVAAAMALSGVRPYFENWMMFVLQIPGSTFGGIGDYGRAGANIKGMPRSMWATVGLPVIALALFATIFLKANPEEWVWFGERMSEFFQQWREFLPAPLEVLFWGVVGGIAIAWLRPGWVHRYLTRAGEQSQPASDTLPASLYQGYRNTLVPVIALFSAYLAYEFYQIINRVFPEGFHYSGYSHEGAFWLTVALALSTIMLSTIFQGSTLNHPRIARLKKLAWVWSGLNLLLAAAVFRRLYIYIEFNGMTRMRVVAILGVAAVIAGFALVLAKIVWNKSFLWLFRRQIWAVSLAAYLYVALPVDVWVNQFNVNQVLSGNLAPSVQIAMHPTSSEGLLQLAPLLECEDDVIREGVRGILALQLAEFEDPAARAFRRHWHWSDYQIADERLKAQLAELQVEPNRSLDGHRVQAFKNYAYQWW